VTESVWDYPRPPRVEPSVRRIRVVVARVTIADSTASWRVLETSHPPVFYIPANDIREDALAPNGGTSWCEFKGRARYWDVVAGDRRTTAAAWSYPEPAPGYEALADHVAFYASLADQCYVDDELVAAQQSDFYGGWITSEITGPFKGGPGTVGW